jgi:hypothetical protein
MEFDTFAVVFGVVGTLIFLPWLLLEVWLRRSPVEEVSFTEREEKSNSEYAFWRVRVRIPSSYQIEEKWVWISAKQYAALEGADVLPVHVRRWGQRTMVRGVHHRGRVWLIGFMALYFGFNLVNALFGS